MGMVSRAQHFGGTSVMSFLIKSSETGAKVHNPYPQMVQKMLEQDMNQAFGECLQSFHA